MLIFLRATNLLSAVKKPLNTWGRQGGAAAAARRLVAAWVDLCCPLVFLPRLSQLASRRSWMAEAMHTEASFPTPLCGPATASVSHQPHHAAGSPAQCLDHKDVVLRHLGPYRWIEGSSRQVVPAAAHGQGSPEVCSIRPNRSCTGTQSRRAPVPVGRPPCSLRIALGAAACTCLSHCGAARAAAAASPGNGAVAAACWRL